MILSSDVNTRQLPALFFNDPLFGHNLCFSSTMTWHLLVREQSKTVFFCAYAGKYHHIFVIKILEPMWLNLRVSARKEQSLLTLVPQFFNNFNPDPNPEQENMISYQSSACTAIYNKIILSLLIQKVLCWHAILMVYVEIIALVKKLSENMQEICISSIYFFRVWGGDK